MKHIMKLEEYLWITLKNIKDRGRDKNIQTNQLKTNEKLRKKTYEAWLRRSRTTDEKKQNAGGERDGAI